VDECRWRRSLGKHQNRCGDERAGDCVRLNLDDLVGENVAEGTSTAVAADAGVSRDVNGSTEKRECSGDWIDRLHGAAQRYLSDAGYSECRDRQRRIRRAVR